MTATHHDDNVHPRQAALTTELRCYYDEAQHRQHRPHCQGIAVVAYGPTRLCATCNAMRSATGRTHAPRPLPGAELRRLIDTAQVVADANHALAHAAHAARQAGASCAQIGDALGLTRQAAQQRWGHP